MLLQMQKADPQPQNHLSHIVGHDALVWMPRSFTMDMPSIMDMPPQYGCLLYAVSILIARWERLGLAASTRSRMASMATAAPCALKTAHQWDCSTRQQTQLYIEGR